MNTLLSTNQKFNYSILIIISILFTFEYLLKNKGWNGWKQYNVVYNLIKEI